MITNGMAYRNVHTNRKPVKKSEPSHCTSGPRQERFARCLAGCCSTGQSRQVRDPGEKSLQLGEET